MLLKPMISPITNFLQARMGINREHDVAIFKKLDAMADEASVDKILNSRIYNSDFRIEDDHVLSDLIEAFNRIENRYLDNTVQLKAEGFSWEINTLLSFVHQTFWPVPGDRLKFRPDPIDPEVYEAEWKELNEKLESTWQAYKEYRMAIKERLKA